VLHSPDAIGRAVGGPDSGHSDQHLAHLPTTAALNYPRPIIMSGACGSSQIPGALGQHPSRSLVTANIIFLQKALHTAIQVQGARHRCHVFLNFGGRCCRTSASSPRGPTINVTSSSTTVVAAVRNTDSTPRGPAIDVFFKFGGGCWQKYREHPLGGPPSMCSSTSVVAAARNTDSTPQGACHRRLPQLR
jgi:hypothetical protein